MLHVFALDPRPGDWSAVAARRKRDEEAGVTGLDRECRCAPGLLTCRSKLWSAVDSVRKGLDAAAGMHVGLAVGASLISDAICQSGVRR